MVENTGLVLEGGGMRGAYTAGVLDFFHDAGIDFPFVAGASAGACNGSSYVAKQRGRNYKVLVEYGEHPEYISYKRALRQKELFGMDFIFDKLPNELVPFDFDSFFDANTKFVVAATDINSGEAVYYDALDNKDDLLKIIRASSSLPLLAPSITFRDRDLMDGGIADPIPIQPSLNFGNEKHVVVLTRNKGYIKKIMKFAWLFKRSFRNYPALVEALAMRHVKYNQTMKMLEEMEKRNEVLLIRPDEPLVVSRIERKKEKLHNLYVQGYKEAENKRSALVDFCQ